MANFTCAGWGARARSTTFARIAGGTTCTTSLRAAKVTHTAPTDGATTFDSPFSAVLLAVWELGISLSPRFWSKRGLFCVLSGLIAAHGGDLSAGGACPSPYARAGGLRTPSAPEPDHQTTGATRAAGRERRTRRGKRSAHGQRPGGRPQRQRGCKGARPARNRPRHRRGARERAPRPPLKFPLGCDPEGGARRGEGGSALRRARRGKGGKPPRNRTASSAPRHGRRCGHRPSKRPEASRGRAGRAQRPRASPLRGRTGERGQRPSRPDRRRRGGQRAREQLPPTTRTRDGATTPADGETAARRAATAQAGRH